MNIVPRNGGNTMQGSFFVSGTGGKLQSDNLTQALKDQGVAAATPLTKVYDVWGAFGGPIMKDRVWYFANAHVGGSTTKSPNVYYNLNAGDPNSWLYVPDLDRLRVLRPDLRECQWPCHMAGHTAPQGQRFLGRAGACAERAQAPRPASQNLHECRRKPWACSAGRWTSRRRHGRGPSRIDCSSTQVLAARPLASATSSGAEPHARSDPCRGAVRERLRKEREHPRAGLPIAGFQHCSHGLVPVEGLGLVRHRHAQPEDRISAHADDGRSDVHDEQPEPQLQVQQRRAESAHPVDFTVGERRACRLAGPVRAGAMDARVG